MKYLFFIITSLIVISEISHGCKSKQEKLNNEFYDLIHKHIKDYNFKNNSNINIYELQILKVDTIGAKLLDTLLIFKCLDKANFYEEMVKHYLKMGSLSNDQATIYAGLNSKTLMDMAIRDAREHQSNAELYIDSSQAYADADSVIRERIGKYKIEDKAYQVKVFLKATSNKGIDSTNLLDTLYYQFDSNKKIIDLDKRLAEIVKYKY